MEQNTEIRKCLFSGEEFIPKRKNQKFANTKNKIAYNNDKAARIRAERAPMNNLLKRNYEILLLLLNGLKQKTVKLSTIDEISFELNVYHMHKVINDVNYFFIYDLSFCLIKEYQSIKIFKL